MTPRVRESGTEGDRRYRASVKSLRHGHHVRSVTGYEPARTVRPETGQEPAFNRPTESDWEPQYPSVRPACFSGDFCASLSGYDPVAIHTRAHWSTAYGWWGAR